MKPILLKLAPLMLIAACNIRPSKTDTDLKFDSLITEIKLNTRATRMRMKADSFSIVYYRDGGEQNRDSANKYVALYNDILAQIKAYK